MLLLSVLLVQLLIINGFYTEHVIKDILFEDYNRYNTIQTYLSSLAKVFPEKVNMFVIGKSYAGRSIEAVKISSTPNEDGDKPIILVDAGMHAREWMAPAVATYLIYQLVQNYTNKHMLTNVDWIIVPLLNPDGYEFSHTHDRQWRKTISRTKVPPCAGVDLNRNFDFHWMESGASKNECSQSYAGPEPFSEPESRALRDLAIRYSKNIKLYINLHAYATMIMFPWSYTKMKPNNLEDHQFLGKMAARAISNYRGTKYEVGRTSALLYIVSGSSCDWMAGVLNVPLNFAIELPKTKGKFQPPTEEIIPTATEMFEGFRIFHLFVSLKWRI